MIRYWLSLIVFLIGIVFTSLFSGNNILMYVDIPSLLIVGIIPFLFVSILFGFKEMVLFFSVSFKKEIEKEKLTEALDFFKIHGKTTWIAGIIAVIIGIIGILVNLEDKAAIGPNVALILISILYSGIINVIIVTPFIIFIKRKMREGQD